MRTIVLAVTAAILTLGGLLAVPQTATAAPGSPKCMTLKEWRQIKANDTMNRSRVARITGIHGRVTGRTHFSDGTSSMDVEYQQCKPNGRPAPGSWNTVWLSYDNYHYSWDYSRMYRHEMRVDYKGAWSTPFWF